MARLTFDDLEPFLVPSSCLIGRSRRCDLVFGSQKISSEHATIAWTSEGWSVQDLGSRNGTFVNGRRIEPGDRPLLVPGMRLGFGSVARCVVESIEPPTAIAQRQQDRFEVEEQGGFIQLVEDPPASVYRDASGTWVLDRGGATERVEDLQEIVVAGASWRLHLPEQHLATAQATQGIAPPRLKMSSWRSR